MKIKILIIMAFLIAFIPYVSASSVCTVYFTGVGCPHCANSDPFLMEEVTNSYKDFVMIEYEIYQQRENSEILLSYDKKYGTGMGVPLIIFDSDTSFIGDKPILENTEESIKYTNGSGCLLLNISLPFEELNLNELPGLPKIWSNGKILIKKSEGKMDEEKMEIVKDLMFSDNFPRDIDKYLLKEGSCDEYFVDSCLEKVEPEAVPLSGKSVYFSDAVNIGGNWVLQYNTGEYNPPEEESFNYIYVIIPILVGLLIGFGLPFLKRGGK